MRRPVYLRGGAAQCTAGASVDAIVDRLLQPAAPPPRTMIPTPLGAQSVPYAAFADARDPVERLADLAELSIASLDGARRRAAALLAGSSSGLLHLQEREYAQAAGHGGVPLRWPYVGELAERIAAAAGVRGARVTFATACSASANALLHGAWMIRDGLADDVVVLGAEFSNQLSLLGFHGLLLLAPERCRPFDRDRAGVVLGEAAVALWLSASAPEDARAWQVLGGGTLCDTSHPTSPAPSRIAHVVAQALDDAQLGRDAVGAIKAHGTGTGSNDLAEGLGLRQAFAERLPPVTSLKGHVGHTLGACGALETLLFARCLERSVVPATGGFATIDPELGFAPVATPIAADDRAVLLNFFGFGGNNCCLALRRSPC